MSEKSKNNDYDSYPENIEQIPTNLPMVEDYLLRKLGKFFEENLL